MIMELWKKLNKWKTKYQKIVISEKFYCLEHKEYVRFQTQTAAAKCNLF